jgi:2-desacetyl-2-hydroxyethyl bacteriochlorophyllide A dehydrogenase
LYPQAVRAAFCTGARAIELREVPDPTPGPDEALVAVHACGICGSDLHCYGGGSRPPRFCLGHEIVGHLVGPAGGLAAGAPVAIEPLITCGRCARCRAGELNLCPKLRILGSLAPGGFADRLVAPVGSLYPVPAGLDLDVATLTEPLAVVVHALELGAVAAGASVLVLGAGVIGLLATFAAVRAGARVTVSARHPHQTAAATALGAAAVVGTDREAILAVAAANAPDVVLESVGGDAGTVELALEAVRPGGRIVVLGVFTHPITLHPLRFLVKEAHLVASMTYCRRGARPDFATALALLHAEQSALAPLVTHRVPLAEIARGFAIAADKSTGALKVAVDVGAAALRSSG